MDANFQTIHRQQQAQDAKLLALAKAVYPLLIMAGGRAETLNYDRTHWDELAYNLNTAFDFELP